ncbi:MAG: DUF1858 domain-containing protein [Calditrichales bacterium]|nr:MAG: DUF1858 domain-containing protein [Calditrichales bacterium]
MEIKANSKLFDVLKAYPELEEKIMKLAPPFKNLKNPVLRKTVGKLATIDRIARIGNLEVTDLLNTLRKEVGQEEIGSTTPAQVSWQEGEPDWIKAKPIEQIDGTEMLSRGVHPLQMINKRMREIKTGEMLLLTTNFKPIPLIDEMQKQNYQVFSRTAPDHPDQHFTFIRK